MWCCVGPDTKLFLDSVETTFFQESEAKGIYREFQTNFNFRLKTWIFKHLVLWSHFFIFILKNILLIFKLLELTLYKQVDASSSSISNTIISSTFVDSFILFTTDVQRKRDNTVIRNSRPLDVWCWITIRCTAECQNIPLILCLVTRDVGNLWWIYSEINNKRT